MKMRVATILIIISTFIIIQGQDNNLLENPGFEAPFITLNNTPANQSIANGWNQWHVPASDSAPDFENLAPEYYEAVNNTRIRSGNNAQRYESFFATHDGGVFQLVNNVGTNREITFSVYAYIWSSGLDDENISTNDGDVVIQVGIDPTGGTDGTSSEIIWSVATESYDTYNKHSVSAITEANNISVWVRTRIGFPVKTSRIYLDDAELVYEDESPQPTDEPTNTPQPTATETQQSQPQPTQTTINPTPTQDNTGTGGPATATTVPTTTPTTIIPIPEEFDGSLIHTVQAGETVSRLATRYGSTISAIQQANGLGVNSLIFVGQQLIIPVALVPTTPIPTATTQVIVVTATPITGTGGPAQGQTIYVVQPGDTLSSIARRFNTTVATLAQINGIVNANSILIGQRINVPRNTTQAPPIATPPSTTPSSYIVQPGDNLYRIALRFNASLVEITRINGISDANRIFVGQQLTLP